MSLDKAKDVQQLFQYRQEVTPADFLHRADLIDGVNVVDAFVLV